MKMMDCTNFECHHKVDSILWAQKLQSKPHRRYYIKKRKAQLRRLHSRCGTSPDVFSPHSMRNWYDKQGNFQLFKSVIKKGK